MNINRYTLINYPGNEYLLILYTPIINNTPIRQIFSQDNDQHFKFVYKFKRYRGKYFLRQIKGKRNIYSGQHQI